MTETITLKINIYGNIIESNFDKSILVKELVYIIEKYKIDANCDINYYFEK